MKKVLAIVDSYNWALYNRATSLQRHLPQFQFTIKHFKDMGPIDFNDFDVVYALNWPIHGKISEKIVSKRKYRLITSISSHIGRGKASSMVPLLDKYDAISVSNKILSNEFLPIFRGKVFYTPFGVETKLFVSKNSPSQFSNIFGWVGNEKRPVKRFDEVKKIIEELGSPFVLKTAFQSDNLDRFKMVDFYNSIGTLICFSESEGTPNPVLEAASCGRAVISTNVGNIPQLGLVKSCVVKNGSELKNAIVSLSKDPVIIDNHGKNLRNKILKDWDWATLSKNFIPFIAGK